MMRFAAVVVALALVGGCDKDDSQHTRPVTGSSGPQATRAATSEPETIGPQFLKYDLNEYDEAGSDVVRGPGGRWISMRYKIRPSVAMDRQRLVSRISDALRTDGWTGGNPPKRQYVLSKIWETSAEDLYFSRSARESEPHHWFLNQAIHVSADASTVCIYAEVGW